MIVELKIPSPGESITEVEVGSLLVEDGSIVERDQEVAEIESEKATLPIITPEGGRIKFLLKPGDTARVGDVIGTVDTDAAGAPAPAQGEKEEKEENSTATEQKPASEKRTAPPPETQEEKRPVDTESGRKVKITPVASRKMEEYGMSVEDVLAGLRRITAADVEKAREAGKSPLSGKESREITREKSTEKMSQLRKKLSSRLVAVKNETAMLTTFNEVDMSRVIRLRKTYQEAFIKKHDIKLGFMSFFIKAASIALMKYPGINSMIEGENIVTYRYADIGVAVQTDKGLMVPVIRNAEVLGLAEIEKSLKMLAEKARRNRITMDDMSGGTFTITNGGVFGSMLSTPLLNPPQAAILGMHNIVERPVAVNGKVEIRPVMYLALSYDHRLVDGRDSVGFLRSIKEMIENPASMLVGGDDAERLLLGL